jgi:Tfp pilus assembly protein PilZ
MVVEYKNPSHLAASIMRDVRPVGMFVDTPFAPEHGTQLLLRVAITSTDETYASPVVVVSNHVGPDFSTDALGMGVRFRSAACQLRTLLEQLDRAA